MAGLGEVVVGLAGASTFTDAGEFALGVPVEGLVFGAAGAWSATFAAGPAAEIPGLALAAVFFGT